MYKVLLIDKKFEPFTSRWGSIATPIKIEEGYVMPFEWANELDKKKIAYTVIEITYGNEDAKI